MPLLNFMKSIQVINSITDTINYADIYNIIRERMSVPTPLLETIVMEIGNEIHNEFPQVRSINISIKKDASADRRHPRRCRC